MKKISPKNAKNEEPKKKEKKSYFWVSSFVLHACLFGRWSRKGGAGLALMFRAVCFNSINYFGVGFFALFLFISRRAWFLWEAKSPLNLPEAAAVYS